MNNLNDKTIKNGSTAIIHYIAKFDDGEVFETSLGKEPLTLNVGHGKILPIIEQSLIGLKSGDIKSVTIPPKFAYGIRQDDLVMEMPYSALKNINPKVGMQIKLPNPNGREIHAKIIKLNSESILIDANHPLAGKTLVYDLKVVRVE